MKAIWIFATLALIACHSAKVNNYTVRSTREISIKGFRFTRVASEDPVDPKLRILEITPVSLPYGGPIAELTTEKRWLEMRKRVFLTIRDECGGAPKYPPSIQSDEKDFKKSGNDLNKPKFLQAKYSCQ